MTWDAKLIRHCTAYPDIINKDAFVFGTYFGIHDRVANFCLKGQDEKKAARAADREEIKNKHAGVDNKRKPLRVANLCKKKEYKGKSVIFEEGVAVCDVKMDFGYI